VLGNAEKIAAVEGGDLDVIIPAALFHDIVIYPKNDSRSKHANDQSAEKAREILIKLDWYPQEKISHVMNAIERCSYSKNLPKESLEEYIVQDADFLESVGTIAVARTFVSTGQMKRLMYCLEDIEGHSRDLAQSVSEYALDLFPARLFRVKERMYTKTAKAIAQKREETMKHFYDAFLAEIKGEQ
ncbi:MAG: hypothetical protein A2V81_02045, partial [Candidatus Abawacabacteria bacterium RBG_16_42_10]